MTKSVRAAWLEDQNSLTGTQRREYGKKELLIERE